MPAPRVKDLISHFLSLSLLKAAAAVTMGFVVFFSCKPAQYNLSDSPQPEEEKNVEEEKPGEEKEIPEAAGFQDPGDLTARRSIRGVWMTHHALKGKSKDDFEKIAQQLSQNNVNTVYLCVYCAGEPLWQSDAYQAAGGRVNTKTDLKAVVTALQNQKIHVAGWFEYGLGMQSINHPIAQKHPDWLQKKKDGSPRGNENGFVFMSPTHPKVISLMTDMFEELVNLNLFQEVQLDRFRWTRDSSKGGEFGYEESTLSAFKEKHGTDQSPEHRDPDWVRFREEKVNELVEAIYKRVKATDPKVIVSVSPVGFYGVSQSHQRWSDWLKGNYMDLVIAQAYNTNVEGFKTHLQNLKSELEKAGVGPSRFGIGLRAHEESDAAMVEEMILHARSEGIHNHVLWVFHYYEGRLGIKDEFETITRKGASWSNPAEQPYVKLD